MNEIMNKLFPCKVSDKLYGTLVVILGELILSPDSYLVRCVQNLPNYTVICVKYGMYSLTIASILFIYDRKTFLKKFLSIGRIGLIAGIIWGYFIVYLNSEFQSIRLPYFNQS